MIEIEISFLSVKDFTSAIGTCNKKRGCKLKIISQTPGERTVIFKVDSENALDFYKLGKEFILQYE